MLLQGKYGNLDASVISYGPCQTPTLTFAVQRHQVITAFQPEDYWSVRPHIAKHEQRYCLCRPILVNFAAGKLKTWAPWPAFAVLLGGHVHIRSPSHELLLPSWRAHARYELHDG